MRIINMALLVSSNLQKKQRNFCKDFCPSQKRDQIKKGVSDSQNNPITSAVVLKGPLLFYLTSKMWISFRNP